MAAPKIPRLHDHEAYAAQNERVRRTAAELRTWRDRQESLKAARPKAPSEQPLEQLLAGPTPETSLVRWRAEMATAAEHVMRLEAALKAERQRLAELAPEAAKWAAEQVRPAYAELQKRMAAAVVELGRLADEETAFQIALREGGVPPRYVGANALGQLRLTTDHGSLATAFLRRAAELHGVQVDL